MGVKFKKGNTQGAGRPKGAKNKNTLLFEGLMEADKAKIYKKAIERAIEGSDTILAKLLDKMLPSLNNNKNENTDMTFEKCLQEYISSRKTKGKAS